MPEQSVEFESGFSINELFNRFLLYTQTAVTFLCYCGKLGSNASM